MTAGWIDPELPFIKSISVEALENSYRTKEIASDSIRIILNEFYNANYPQVISEKREKLNRAIEEVQKIYSRNYFPEMNVSWKKFPDQIGHLYYTGCFRCHDGKHVSDDGKVISKECNVCHVVLAQKFEKDLLRLSLEGIDYIHPVQIGNAWMEMNCSDCHGT